MFVVELDVCSACGGPDKVLIWTGVVWESDFTKTNLEGTALFKYSLGNIIYYLSSFIDFPQERVCLNLAAPHCVSTLIVIKINNRLCSVNLP